MNRSIALVVLAAAALGAAGCVTHETRPQTRINATQASQEIPQDQLLDVAVKLFEENTPTDEKKLEKEHIFPEVRKAEARYFPMQIRNTLEGSGQWGQVRVHPRGHHALDVFRSTGKIIESNGRVLRIDIAATDATGRVWFKARVPADRRYALVQGSMWPSPRDPFQNVYSTLANDMLASGNAAGAIWRTCGAFPSCASRRTSRRTRSSLSRRGQEEGHVPGRAPARGRRSAAAAHGTLRERDYALLDTSNEYYSLFAENMAEPYTNWRQIQHDELEAEDEAKRRR